MYRISADHLDVDLSSHIGRLRRTEAERVREPEADPAPAEPAQPEEASLSVAERISSLETLSAVAPWRLAKRTALPSAPSGTEQSGAVPKRRFVMIFSVKPSLFTMCGRFHTLPRIGAGRLECETHLNSIAFDPKRA